MEHPDGRVSGNLCEIACQITFQMGSQWFIIGASGKPLGLFPISQECCCLRGLDFLQRSISRDQQIATFIKLLEDK